MITFTELKKKIVADLKSIKDIEVAFEELSKTKESETLDEWFFVSLLPVTNQLNGEKMRDRSFIIDVAYWHKDQTRKRYFEMNESLDKVFQPCFHILDRHITIPEVTFKIVDNVAHYVFTLKFTDLVVQQEAGEPAEELDFTII